MTGQKNRRALYCVEITTFSVVEAIRRRVLITRVGQRAYRTKRLGSGAARNQSLTAFPRRSIRPRPAVWGWVSDLPLNRRSEWRAALGIAEPTSRRCLLHDAADRVKIVATPGSSEA